MTHDLIVVGEGFAGLHCAAECARLGLNVATFEAEFFGGLVVNVNELSRFEAADGLSGMDYAGTLAMENRRAGVKSSTESVSAVTPIDGGFEVTTDSGTHTSRFVVMASGAHLRKLDVPGEAEYEGRGVSHCADCDAPLFTDEAVAVIGSGEWAVRNALLLANECSAVHLVYAAQQIAAEADRVAQLQAESKIQLHPGLAVQEVLGDERGMTGLRLRDAAGASQDLAVAGLFVVDGLVPNSEMAPAEAARDASGYLEVDQNLETPVPGLWAIGQVRAGFDGWLEHAVDDARRVAQQVKARAG